MADYLVAMFLRLELEPEDEHTPAIVGLAKDGEATLGEQSATLPGHPSSCCLEKNGEKFVFSVKCAGHADTVLSLTDPLFTEPYLYLEGACVDGHVEYF